MRRGARDEAREERIDIDPEPAAHDRRRARRLGGGVLDARQQRLHLLDRKCDPSSVSADSARSAVEQPDAHAVLAEPRDRRG